MKTIDYIKKYGLDKNNKSLSKLEKDEFFKDLEKELLERIQERERNYTEDNLPYRIFQILVKQVNDKFWAISNKKKGIAFTFELWNAFFAIKVIPIRNKYFPEMEKSKITAELETNPEGSAFLIPKNHRYETFGSTN